MQIWRGRGHLHLQVLCLRLHGKRLLVVKIGWAHIRLVHHMALPEQQLWLMLLADDFKVEPTSETPRKDVLFVLTLLKLFKVPFSWRKTQGGDVITWIGYTVFVRELRLGVSEARATWAVNWLRRVSRDGTVVMEDLRAALGGLSFLSGALEYDKPFLAPLFAFL